MRILAPVAAALVVAVLLAVVTADALAQNASRSQYGPTPTPTCVSCTPPTPPRPPDLPSTGYALYLAAFGGVVLLVLGAALRRGSRG